jgi:hypothetical protein
MTIKTDAIAIGGKLSFNHLTAPDDFKGKSKYKVRITNLSDAACNAIVSRFGEDAGMGYKRIRFDEKYPEQGQYVQFSSSWPIKVKLDKRDIIVGGKDSNGNDVVKVLDPVANSIGYGSGVVAKIFGDSSGNPRVSFIDIVDLVPFEAADSDDYDAGDIL